MQRNYSSFFPSLLRRQEENMQNDNVSNYSYDNIVDENLGNFTSIRFLCKFFFVYFIFNFVFLFVFLFLLFLFLMFGWYEFFDYHKFLNDWVNIHIAAGSIKTFQSMNSLATSMATSLAISSHSMNSDDSDKTTEVTRL